MEYPISLYYDTDVSDIKTLDLCRGDDDYRKIFKQTLLISGNYDYVRIYIL